jgi:Phage integrase, N-terminal SAM-like domain
MTQEQTMTPLRTRMIEDMKLAGLAAKTQEVYLQAVSSLAKRYKKSPELVTEEEVRRYLLDVRERNARGSFKVCHYGIQFFYRNTLGKDWALFKKRSGCPSGNGCRRPFRMPRCGAFSTVCAIRSIAAASA